jgi:putative flippase GtrA
VGYIAGLAISYVFLTRFVFDPAASGKSEGRLLAEFGASGIAGVLVTACVITLATSVCGLSPAAGKGLAIVTSFAVVFVVRRCIVFAQPAARARSRSVA